MKKSTKSKRVSAPAKAAGKSGLMAAARRVKVPAWACTCQRCGHTWTALGDVPPRSCAGCKATGWGSAARPYGKA